MRGRRLVLFLAVTTPLAGCSLRSAKAPDRQAPAPAARPAPPPRLIPVRRADAAGDALPAGAIGRLGSRRFAVWARAQVAFSPDGKLLAAADSVRVSLLELESGKPRAELTDVGGVAAFSDDGGGLVVGVPHEVELDLVRLPGGRRTTLVKVRAPRGETERVALAGGTLVHWWNRDVDRYSHGRNIDIYRLDRPRRRLASLPAGPAGRYAAVGVLALARGGGLLALADKQRVDLWSLPRPRLLGSLDQPGISALRFTDGDRTLLAAGGGAVVAWEVAGLKEARRQMIQGCAAAALSADGQLVACAGDALTVRRVRGGEVLADLGPNTGAQPVFSPDGAYLAITGEGGKVPVWRLRPAPAAPLNPGHAGKVSDLALSPDGRRAATLDNLGMLRLWDLATGVTRWRVKAHDKSSDGGWLVFSADGETLAASTGIGYYVKKRAISFWRASDGKRLGGIADAAGALRRGPVSGDLYWRDKLALWRGTFAGGETVKVVEEGVRDWVDFSLADDEKRVITTEAIHALPSGKRVSALGTRWTILDAALLPGGGLVQAGNRVLLARDGDGAALRPLVGPDEPQQCVALSSDRRLVASGGSDEKVYIWSAASGALLASFQGHEDDVTRVAFADGDRALLSASEDGTVLIWDVEPARARLEARPASGAHRPRRPATPAAADVPPAGTPRRLGTGGWCPAAAGIKGQAFRLAFTDDGKALVSAHYGGHLALWDAASGKLLRPPLALSPAPLDRLALSPDARWVAGGTTNGGVGLWRLQDGKRLVLAPPDPFGGRSFLVTHIPAVAAADDGTLAVWWYRLEGTAPMVQESRRQFSHIDIYNAARGNKRLGRIWPMRHGSGEEGGMALSPDGKLLALLGERDVRLFSLPACKPAGRIAVRAESGRFLPGGASLALVSGQRVLFYDPTTLKRQREARLPSRGDTFRSVSPAGDLGIYWDTRYTEAVRLSDGERAMRMVHEFSSSEDRALSPAADALAINNGARGFEVRRRGDHTPSHSAPIIAMAAAPGGRRAASLDHKGLLLAWDLAGGRPLWHARLPVERDAPPRAGLAFSPDGRTLLAPLLGRGLVALDSATGQQRYTLAGEAPLALRFTSGGALIWGGVAGGLARSKPPGALPEPLAGITAGPVLAISPGGDLVQLGAQLLGVERANLVGNPAGDGLRAAAFFPQSQRLVRVGKQAAIVDSASGKRLVELKGHEGDLLAAAVSPDGRLVSAGGAGGAVYVWEARTGKARPALKGHKGAVNALCFTPDGKRLLSAGEDAVVLVWGL